MKKAWLVLFSVLPLFSFAADTTTQDVKTYLDQLQVKLDHAAQRANQPTAGATGVVGLRGTKQTAGALPLYWKDSGKPVPVTPEELKIFRSAVEQAKAGQRTEAVATLTTFQTTYPRSALLPDVKETLQRLQ
jgi:TolA-binding protein